MARAPVSAAEAAAPVTEVDHDFLIVKVTLDALNEQTGNDADHAAQQDVRAFRADPGNASLELFARVSSLTIRRWFASAQEKPNDIERKNLWITLRRLLDKDDAVPNPTNWSGGSEVIDLAILADEKP